MIAILATAIAVAAPAGPSAAQACPELVTAEAMICRAIRAQAKGDFRDAAQAFEQAALASSDQDPAAARMWAAAGNMWLSAGENGKAAFALDKALALPGLEAEQHGEALLDRARAAEALGDLKTARAKLDEAAKSVGGDPFYWYFSAALAIREGDRGKAQTAITQALALAPNDPTVLFEAGHVAQFSDDAAKARDYWSKAAAADPQGKIGKAAREAMQLLDAPPAKP